MLAPSLAHYNYSQLPCLQRQKFTPKANAKLDVTLFGSFELPCLPSLALTQSQLAPDATEITRN
jgi:hypothetical protein